MKLVGLAGLTAAALVATACMPRGDAEPAAGAATATAPSTSTTAAAGTADTAAAEAFLREQLASYSATPPPPPSAAEADAVAARERTMTLAQFIEQEVAQNRAIYTPALVDLMRRDRLSTEEGSVGVLDFQPFCGCNDDSGLVLSGVTTAARPDGAVEAVATINTAPGGGPPFTRRFILHNTAAGWRIADVFSSDATDPGLLATMTRGVAEQERAMQARPAG